MEISDFHRAEDHLTVPIGTIVQETESSYFWVFFGWSRNTVGLEMNFVKVPDPNWVNRVKPEPYHYHCSGLATVLRKFPELERFKHGNS